MLVPESALHQTVSVLVKTLVASGAKVTYTGCVPFIGTGKLVGEMLLNGAGAVILVTVNVSTPSLQTRSGNETTLPVATPPQSSKPG